MKGIILAGGNGTRLYPITKGISKQLLPVYDKPMIYYPLATLMLFEIRDILIISTPQDLPNIQKLFNDGSLLGINIQYAIQDQPQGIAQAFTIGSEFIGNDDVCLILGDNIFYLGDQFHMFKSQVIDNPGAIVFGYHVPDPERFGVLEIDINQKVLSIEEKPANPKSNYATVGLYFYKNDVVQKARDLKVGARGEYEITDLNNLYLSEGRLSACILKRGTAWLDAGTPDSLIEASIFVQLIEKRQGLKICCIEEIAFRMGFIDRAQTEQLISEFVKGSYKEYLQKIYKEFLDHGF